MATHSSTLAWKIPWTEKPGRLQPMRVAKSRTRLSDFTSLHFMKDLNSNTYHIKEHLPRPNLNLKIFRTNQNLKYD